MYPPIPHDLTIYDDQFDFEKNGFHPHQWEISVPQKNCIVWSVVVSYLRSSDFSVPGKFEERLNRLTENTFDPETVKSSILDFNPFFNIHKCFFDETLQKIIHSFRKVLSKNRPAAAPKTIAHDLQLISTLLKSNILIVNLSSKNLHLLTPPDGSSTDPAAIILFCREYSNKDAKKPVVMKRFTFSLNKDLCWELRKDAFRIILEASDFRSVAEKEIQSLTEKKEKKINILIALLKKNLTDVISQLYDSSYIVAKLADAGFETDPRVQDADGFSAFYHALQSDDNDLIYILYRYAANNCCETENTFRDPNPCVISNFSKLKEILNGDCARSNNFEKFGEGAERARVTYQDLLRFNEFLTLVTCGINEIRTRVEGGYLEEAAKQKERVSFILDTYDAFFSIGQSDFSISKPELIENYTKHKTFFDNLDFTVALLFFDNIYLLKSVLISPCENFYSDIESSFLLSTVTNKYFTGDAKKGTKILDLGIKMNFNNFSLFSLLERFNLREKVKKLCGILREKKLSEEDIVQSMPQHVITGRLRCFQELKDEFLISRLDHYMKTALESTPEGLKQKLVIQRALQVIGDSISVEEEDPSSIRHLLRKCLPDDTVEVLKKARNTLSHLKSFQFPLKFDTEEDDSLFISIQSEIRIIKELFQKVFDIQGVRFMEFLINRGLESAQKLNQGAGIEMHPVVEDMKNLREGLRKRTLELTCISDQEKLDGHRLFVPGIDELCQKLTGFASKVQIEQIRGEIPPDVRTRVISIEKLEEDIERGIAIEVDRFDSLFLKTKDLCGIKHEYEKFLQDECEVEPGQTSKRSSLLHRIQKSPNLLQTLDLIFEKKKVSDSQLKALYETIPFSDRAKSTLNSLIGISKSHRGNNLENLLNRIKHLHELSINEQYDIRFMWERAKSSKAKQHLVYKIVQRYLREPSFQASMEMLLFDCFVILKNNDDFRYFWKKDSLLFNGIDLRNVLAFGDPLVESIGEILDPKDLPSELVKKMLQLFEDQECIETLCDLWQKEKQSDKIPGNFSEWYKSKKHIVGCARWQEYSKLLAEDPEDSEICEAVVSFLKNVTEPNRTKKY